MTTDMKVKRIDSTDTNVSKYVFDFDGTAVAEAVLYRYGTFEERTVICCSTQSGCPVGCRFCGAGDSFVRNLTAAEIVYQVDRLFFDRGIVPKNVKKGQIMFMSMGEPMLNFGALEVAIRVLAVSYPNFQLLVSTSAPAVSYDGIIRLSEQIPTVGLQFSVHESTDEARNKLIPFKAKLTLSEIAATGSLWASRTGRRPFFNYCATPGNTTDDDARRLADLFSPYVWNATVSVVCERDENVAAANARQRALATGFMAKLASLGFDVRCFDPAGQDDIGGGCGQLWFVQDWMRAHPELARPSIGRGLVTIHPVRSAKAQGDRT